MTASRTTSDPILVGTDGNAGSDPALLWASMYAQRTSAPLHVVHAWQVQAVVTAFPAGPVPILQLADSAALTARRTLADAVERTGLARAHPELSAHALQGPASLVLERVARDAALVVVGRQHGPLARVLLGSVGTALLHHCDRPVVVVPHDLPEPGQAPERVVLAIDPADPSRPAPTLATRTALLFDVPLRAVAVRTSFADGLLETPSRRAEHEQREWRAVLDAVREVCDEPALKTDVVSTVGRPGAVLVEGAVSTDLLVVGSRGRGSLAGHVLGSTSLHVAHAAPCPVVVTR